MKLFYKSKFTDPLNFIQAHDIDSVQVFEIKTQEKIKKINEKLSSLKLKVEETIDKKSFLIKDLQKKCKHDECLEELTYYDDEYGDTHDGPKVRLCIKCFYKEEECGYFSERRDFAVLKTSKIVRLYKNIDNKKFELEIKDLEIK